MITADNITNEQIRELRRLVVGDPATSSIEADDFCNLVGLALDDGKLPHRIIRDARARCAERLAALSVTDDAIKALVVELKAERRDPNHPSYDHALGLFGVGKDLAACADALNTHLDPTLRHRARAHCAAVIASRRSL